MEARFDAFTNQREILVKGVALDAAFDKLEHLMSDRGLVPQSPRSAAEALPSYSTTGYPYLAPKGALRDILVKDSRRLIFDCHRGKAKVYPCYGAARRVIREQPKNKPRLVWAYPGEMAVIENMYAGPVTEKLMAKPWFGTQIKGYMSSGFWRWKMFGSTPNQAQHIISADFESFDSSVPAFLIRRVFSLIWSMFDSSALDTKITRLIEDYFIHTPINLYGTVRQKHRGIPSGSCFTQIVGTLCNMVVYYYMCELVPDLNIDLTRSMWLGDDSRVFIHDYMGGTPETIIHILTKVALSLGMVISESKSIGAVVSYESALYRALLTKRHDAYPSAGRFLSRELAHDPPFIRFDFEKFKAQVLIPEQNDKLPEFTLGRLFGLVYAYGWNRKAYDLLLQCVVHLRRHYRVVKPAISLRDKGYLARALGRLELDFDPALWPEYEQLRLMYYGYC
jgi:hypothetical protein